MFGTNSEAGIRRLDGDPAKLLPDGWQTPDPRTGAPVGISKGWDYAPGSSVSETIAVLSGKLGTLPQQPSMDLILDWLRSETFARWFDNPVGNFPILRISEADAERIGTRHQVAAFSTETALKQERAHPEISVFEYADAQRVVTGAKHVIPDGRRSLIFVRVEPGQNGHVLVVKATASGEGLFLTSFRRINGSPEMLARTLRRLIRKQDK